MYIFIMGLCTVSSLLLLVDIKKNRYCISSLDCTAALWEKPGNSFKVKSANYEGSINLYIRLRGPPIYQTSSYRNMVKDIILNSILILIY